MYINQLITYLMWPAFIITCWIIIKSALILYEKKFPGKQILSNNLESFYSLSDFRSEKKKEKRDNYISRNYSGDTSDTEN